MAGRALRLALAAAGMILLAGLARQPAGATPPAAPAAASPADPGAALYRQHCASCHDEGINRAPQRRQIGEMTPEAIHRALTDGAMIGQADALTAAEKVAVSEYLAGRRLGAATAPAAQWRCTGRRARFAMDEPPAFSGWGLDPQGSHAIPAAVSGLDRAKVGRLRLKWAFGFPESARVRSQPAVAGGAILVGNQNGKVYALDRETGCLRWHFAARAEVRTGIVVTPWRAGDRKAQPLVFFGDLTGTVYAVRLRDGTLAWQSRADTHPAAVITGTPTLWEGTLYVPVSSLEEAFATARGYPCCSFRGSVVAMDASTGRERWRTWLVGEPQARTPNRDGIDQFGPSGVAVWNSPAIDAKRGQLFVATGDNYSLPATGLSDAVVALDLATGHIRWHYQALAGDAWNVACVTNSSANCPDEDAPDFDFGAGTILAKGRDGRERVLAGQKSGRVWALDPDTGKLAWQTRVGRGSAAGGVLFGMAAADGRLFVPIADRADFGPPDFPSSPGLHALDIAGGGIAWSAPSPVDACKGRPAGCVPGYGGSVTTTAGMVLAGGDDGRLTVYDAADGRVLWQADTLGPFASVNGIPARGGAISGGAAPIAHRGQVIVASGYGYAGKMTGNALLVYEAD